MPNIIKPSGINLLWAAGGTKTDPGQSKINTGWVVELPPYQYQNWLDNRQDTFIAHINQHGVAEWDSETEYQGNLSYTQGSDGMIYKCIQTNTNRNPTNPVNNTYWTLAFEVYGSVAIVQSALNAHIANYQTLAGLTNLAAARSNLDVFSKAESDTRFAALLGSPANQFKVADATLSNHAVPLGQLNSLLAASSEVSAGVIQIATVGEVETGTNNTKAITPAKGQAVYLKKSQNLIDLPNKATARTNLGLADTATIPSSTFMQGANNLSEVASQSVARANLGLGTAATQPIGFWLQAASNLSDLTNVTAARSNLGLTSLATTNPASVMFKSDNLAGLTNVAQARTNLGLSDSGLYPSNTWLIRTNNLGDLTNAQTARNNLGLGSASTMSAFGTNGSLDFTATDGYNGQYILPNGFIEKWGQISIGADASTTLTFPVAFPNACYNLTWTLEAGYHQSSTGMQTFSGLSRFGCTIHNGDNLSGIVHYRAVGR